MLKFLERIKLRRQLKKAVNTLEDPTTWGIEYTSNNEQYTVYIKAHTKKEALERFHKNVQGNLKINLISVV